MPKLIQSLSVVQINAAKPKPKLYRLYDGRGLCLVINPSGKKVWRFEFKRPDGARDSMTFGGYPALSLAAARALREEKLQSLAQNQSIKNAKHNTFEQVYADWTERWLPTVSHKYGQQVIRAINANALPHLKGKNITEIRAVNIVESLTGMEKRGKLEYLRRVRVSLKLLFDFACARGLIDYNPVLQVGSQAFAAHKPSHFEALDYKELHLFDDYLVNCQSKVAAACAAFQFLTMVRPSEASQATWQEIDFDNKVWTIPAHRMKKRHEHVVPLSAKSLKVLNLMRGIHPEFIFIGKDLNSSLNAETVRTSLRRFGLKTTAHGLRSTASTLLNESGKIRHDVIEACLAHKDKNTVRSAYNRAEYIEERREALEFLASHLKFLD